MTNINEYYSTSVFNKELTIAEAMDIIMQHDEIVEGLSELYFIYDGKSEIILVLEVH